MIIFRFHITERDNTITFEEFLSYFPDNEVRNLNIKHKIRIIYCFLESET